MWCRVRSHGEIESDETALDIRSTFSSDTSALREVQPRQRDPKHMYMETNYKKTTKSENK
jgi:hypothetical protein